ncbi:MAG: hypothetical protein NT103_08320 [Campylobacterales bacterium]|nr:hypothetical protein [Campylobacterales bacterium]
MAMKSGMAGVEIDYDFVKDFSNKEGLDPIDTYGLFRRMTAEFNAKK